MDRFIIEGGTALKGEIEVRPAKNALLPCMAAALLTPGKVTLSKTSSLMDIHSMCSLLEHLGVSIDGSPGNSISFCSSDIKTFDAPYDLVRKMRASVLVLGPLLARFGRAKVSLPGGCAIGARPVDQHIKGLCAMGAEISVDNGYIFAKAKELTGTSIFFDKVTVGGTENILTAAVLAKGKTILGNAAREPEIVDLGNLLVSMGAKIEGLGTDTITVDGVGELHGASHAPIPDRIETGTILAAVAITGGEASLKSSNSHHLEAFISKLRDMGVLIDAAENEIRVGSSPELRSADITTAPFPGFPTDLQAQFMALLTQAKGSGTVREEIFETRFMHIPELQRLGADIRLEGNVAVVTGKAPLKGAPVMASDLRASASLVIAGLAAKGRTEISRIYHLDRGYERFEERLSALGARIERVRG
jgi:UDP-N-acetylglucosamine 1-carboxyvinyltransferase